MSDSVLHVGCAMWTHRHWAGRHIPATTSAGGELAAYSRVVNAVEGNTTFYALPRPSVVDRWAESVPEDFRFMFKLPRIITHERRLRACAVELEEFLVVLEPVEHLLEPISIQLPASFGPGDLGVIDRFLDGVPRSFHWAVEVRHRGFFDGDENERRLNDLLFAHGTDRIILDSRALFAGPRETREESEAFESKPRLPVRAVATGARPVVRFIGQTNEEANPAYWAPWVATTSRWIADGRRPFVFLHTPDNVAAPALARRFHAEVAAVTPGLRALGDAPPVDAPGLFD